MNEFHFESQGPEETHLTVQIGALEGTELPQEAADAVLAQQKENMEHLKEFCEKDKG